MGIKNIAPYILGSNFSGSHVLGREYLDSSEDGMFLDSSRSASLLHLQSDNLLL